MKKNFAFFLLLIFSASSLYAGQPPQVAGSFYPADAKELESQIVKYLKITQVPSLQTPRVLLVPHAGYEYSGAVAGQAFSQIQDSSIAVAIVLGVAHQYPLSGAAIDPKGNFATPLGKIEIDSQSVQRLQILSKKIKSDDHAFKGEHSLEVELPFLQKSLSHFKLVPMMMHTPDLESAREIGEAIATVIKENELAGRKTILVISSDLAHYPNREDAQTTDLAILKFIEKVDPEGLFKESQELLKKKIPNLATTMCGEAGVLAGLFAAKALGISEAKVLQHATSADVPGGDPAKVVGYGAVAFYDKEGGLQKDAAETLKTTLTAVQKKDLLDSAKSGVKEFVETGALKQKVNISDPAFAKPQAVFVTLRKKGELRGCVGSTYPKWPLKQAVIFYAVAAATQDHRFSPVTKEELPELTYEVSILSAQKPATVDSIREGVDGVILAQGNHVGVFLPQVWQETGCPASHYKKVVDRSEDGTALTTDKKYDERQCWNKEQFLNELASQKAGLTPDAWKDPRTQLYTFTTDTFEDEPQKK